LNYSTHYFFAKGAKMKAKKLSKAERFERVKLLVSGLISEIAENETGKVTIAKYTQDLAQIMATIQCEQDDYMALARLWIQIEIDAKSVFNKPNPNQLTFDLPTEGKNDRKK
jgi:hypothetical protein